LDGLETWRYFSLAMSTHSQDAKRKPRERKAKARKNFSISEETAELLRKEAQRQDCSMSALLTRWILEKTGNQ